jgi:hypothetical protein
MSAIQWISLVGAVLILAAFTLQQLGHWTARGLPYLWCNVLGAGLLTVVALFEAQWGFLLLESVWTAVSVYGLARRSRVP